MVDFALSTLAFFGGAMTNNPSARLQTDNFFDRVSCHQGSRRAVGFISADSQDLVTILDPFGPILGFGLDPLI